MQWVGDAPAERRLPAGCQLRSAAVGRSVGGGGGSVGGGGGRAAHRRPVPVAAADSERHRVARPAHYGPVGAAVWSSAADRPPRRRDTPEDPGDLLMNRAAARHGRAAIKLSPAPLC